MISIKTEGNEKLRVSAEFLDDLNDLHFKSTLKLNCWNLIK